MSDYFDAQRKNEEDVLKLFIAEISIEGKLSQETVTIIVEGILDTEVFTKIRSTHVNIISIHQYRERCEIPFEINISNKSLVKKLAKELNKDPNCVVIGIQDLDYEDIRNLLKGLIVEPKKEVTKNNAVTSPSTDIEMLLISELLKNDALPFEEMMKPLIRSMVLSYARLGVEKMKIEGGRKLKQSDIDSLAPQWTDYRDLPDAQNSIDSAKRNYLQACESLKGICKALVESKPDANLEEQLMASMAEAEEQIKNAELDWSSFIKGHDLQWFIIYFNRLNNPKFRKKLVAKTKYEFIKGHQMFEKLESWRISKELPPLFA